MKRVHVTLVVTVMSALFVAFDAMASDPLNPYTAPPLFALGSGLAATGAHCAAPPPPAQ
ncbi:hypothetical protein [uncultured Roseovarius sp.]|uniref:hypothetical protein n=1 Tax=uncultured Roseovarius sp. TaxID=293344 RepID=UPI00260623DC|nr:hypothetical protein [uncultured Roseovarius sp.]